ncbi:galactokinase [Winogradskyella sp. A3E31]|uniref:galactokinase n=1 Tax=Winogradskyella sp. A3E31 TaxID=3349637 RepID=UPI00398AD972
MDKKLITSVKKGYKDLYKTDPLCVFSPGRINIIGEHTDYNNGYVLPAAIDKGIVLAIGKSDSNHSTITSIDMNDQMVLNFEELERIDANNWKNYIIGVIAEIFKKGKVVPNFNCVFAGNIPVGSGLSSSAALENSLAFGCNELFNLGFSKKELIYISQSAEHNYVGVNCGIMDQFASMFGEKDKALFLDCKYIKTETIPVNLNDYEIILINSNVKHALAESEYNNRYAVCQKIVNLLNKPSLREVSYEDLSSVRDKITESEYKKGLYILQENERVIDCKEALKNNDLLRVGELLFQSHEGQSKMYDISCKELDFLVNVAKQSDSVIGARMMGGGFGGCTINVVLKNESEHFKNEVSEAYKLELDNECSIYSVVLSEGTQLIK